MTSKLGYLGLIYLLLLSFSIMAQAEPIAKTSNKSATSAQPNDTAKGTDGNSGKPFEQIDEVFSPGPETWLGREWEKARIRFSVAPVESGVNIGKNLNLGFSLKYEYDVQPAFAKSFQHRFDRYNAYLGASVGLKNVGLGKRFGAEITFARLYPTKGEAMKAIPYFLDRAPWTSKKALEGLRPGDVVRIEIASDGSLSTGVSEIWSKSNGHFGISVDRGSRLVTDVYRMTNNMVRVRLIGLRHEANLGASLGVNLISNFNLSVSLLDRIFDRWFKFRPLNGGVNGNFGRMMPVETFMVDYVFNLNHPDAIAVYDNLLRKIETLRFFKTLDILLNEEDVGRGLVELIAPAEELHLRDRLLPIEQKSLVRIFKGRTDINFWSLYFESRVKLAVEIWNKRTDSYVSRSLVRGFDDADQPVDLVYLTDNSVSQFQGLYQLYKTSRTRNTEALFKGERRDTGKNYIEVTPNELSDLIFEKNLDDVNLSQKQIRRSKDYLEFVSPKIAGLVNWGRFTSGGKKINGYIRNQILFHREALLALPNLSASEIYTDLRDLLEKHPQKNVITPRIIPQNAEDSTVQIYGKFEYDIREISYKMATILNSTDNVARLEAFADLRHFELFNELLPAFMVKRLPQDNLESFMSVTLHTGAQDGSGFSFKFGSEGQSAIYASLQMLLAIINNRSFDMRIQLNENGNFSQFKASDSNSRSCENCDGFMPKSTPAKVSHSVTPKTEEQGDKPSL
jgi:hypothetical protein